MASVNKVKIVLVTMVKNEQANMRRLITSVKSWIDGVVVCDTGSTDDTVKITKETLEEYKISTPGRISGRVVQRVSSVSKTGSLVSRNGTSKMSTDYFLMPIWSYQMRVESEQDSKWPMIHRVVSIFSNRMVV